MRRAYAEKGFAVWTVRLVINGTHYHIASFSGWLPWSKSKAFELAQSINEAEASARLDRLRSNQVTGEEDE